MYERDVGGSDNGRNSLARLGLFGFGRLYFEPTDDHNWRGHDWTTLVYSLFTHEFTAWPRVLSGRLTQGQSYYLHCSDQNTSGCEEATIGTLCPLLSNLGWWGRIRDC